MPDAMAAGKQEATQRLQSILADGRKLATLLRVAIKQRYGNTAEKLVEFDRAELAGKKGRARPAVPVVRRPGRLLKGFASPKEPFSSPPAVAMGWWARGL